MQKPSFSQLVDVGNLQELMNRFYAATGIPVGIIGVDGVIHIATGWQEICTGFHRVHPETLARCRESDQYINDHLHVGGYAEYRCKNGMRDLAVPLVVAGEHLATLFLGQFFYDDEVLNRDFFIDQARHFGFDESAYLAALDAVPVFSRDKVKSIMDYYTFFVGFLMETGLVHLKQLEAEQALRESKQALVENEERYRLLFEQCPDDVVIVDPHSLKVVDFNDAAHARLGYTREEFAQLSVPDYVEGVGPDYIDQRERALSEEGTAVFRLRDRTKSGDIRDTIVSVRRLELGGRPMDHCVIKDVTELKRMREELEKAQKLESLGIVAGRIAHDFNNVLTGIQGNLSIMRLLCGADDRMSERIDSCENSVAAAARLTRQLITFSSGGAPVKKVLDPRDVIEDSLSAALRGSQVAPRCELAADLWPVEADAAQLAQAVCNLLANAREAMAERGTLHVSAANRTDTGGGHFVVISVRDEGCGIAPEHLDRIFDPYFTTKEGATGLGLPILFSIVTRHGGQVKVSSNLGEGASFEVWLPASPARQAEESAERRTTGDCGRYVIVMDDDEVIREVTKDMLTMLGYRVETFCDGSELIERYLLALEAGERPAAAILDLTVPGRMGGIEAASRILQVDPAARLIVSSGYSNDAAMSNYREYGFMESLSKPFRVNQLDDVLRRVTRAECPETA